MWRASSQRLHFHFSLSCTGEGNGNSLQCSYLENPRDGGAWWAAFYAVAQSRIGLEQVSSSSKRWKSLDYALAYSACNGMNLSYVSHSPDWLTDWQYTFFLSFFFSVLLCLSPILLSGIFIQINYLHLCSWFRSCYGGKPKLW